MSKSIIEGTVEKILVRDKEEDQWGNKHFVSALIGEQWVGFGGKKQPQINYKEGQSWKQLQEGDVVEVVAETNAKGYLQAKASDITVKGKGNVGDGGRSASSGGSVGSGSNSNPVAVRGSSEKNDHRQDSIMRQSAMGYAAQIVSQTLTSKSNLDQAAADVVRIADEHFLPYAKNGRQVEREALNESVSHQATQVSQDAEDFSDDIPF